MGRLVYLDGQLVPKEQARISVFDHGLLYGDGVFEGIRIYGGKVFRLDKHLWRLYESARLIHLAIPLSTEAMNRAVLDAVAANGDLRNGYIRLIVTRGVGTLGLNPRLCKEQQVIVIVDTIAIYSDEMYERGLEVIIAQTIRNQPGALDPRVKSLNYLNNIMAKVECLEAGAAEAIMLNHEGCVAEATGDNVFIVRGGTVLTPPLSAGCLPGITREEVFDICRALDRKFQEADLRPADLYGADECFLTGTAAEVIAVARIDGRPVGSGHQGPVTQAIREEFHRRIREG